MTATLRIDHHASQAQDQHEVSVSLEGDGLAPLRFTAAFPFTFTQQERNDIRWYLETYLQYPLDPADKRAARVEALMADLGERLFRAVFEADRDAFKLWARLQADLNATRIEVAGDHPRAWTLPWELLRDPDTETYLALHAQAFVRVHLGPAREVRLPQTAAGEPIRILLVIARPGLEADVPYRSVARRVVAALGGSDTVRLDVLRPPTYAALAQRLRQAKDAGAPYHVVHFDGHGMYADLSPKQNLSGILKALSALLFTAPRQGEHGYLLFENPEVEENVRPVDGPTLGDLLVETSVGVLVLNACRSGRAAEDAEGAPDDAAPKDEAAVDRHDRVRAFGSLAQEVMDAGVPGVVAMRHNVYVVTAARFVAELYAALLRGRTLGQAVTAGRKHLSADPLRAILYQPVPLQDWTVPVVYEPAPIRLFPEPDEESGDLTLTLDAAAATPGRGDQIDLPAPPDVGFFGRDETLLRLDRAFDRHAIALLHGYAGSGKTTAAAEFARWYGLTGGVQGPVLFTSFEQYLPLPRVLDVIGRVFEPLLRQNGINWLAKDDDTRRDIALQILAKIPVLWIWDNVEEVAGFPSGTESAWSEAEQRALADFLRDLRQRTQARVLLTSRRDERGWLGELPARIAVPPMPMRERVQLARALADRYGARLEPLEAWRPLLRFTGGNPLTLTVVVGQALRDELTTKRQIGDFVRRLRAGEAAFDDEQAQGRSRSLGASLAYGFEHAFSEEERARLALLHLFQGFVNAEVLRVMGHPDADWSLEPIRGLTCDNWRPLLDRAAEVGLLHAHGGGYYRIHPALPWYFRQLFHEHYPDAAAAAGEDAGPPSPVFRRHATRAYVEAVGELGNYYWRQYEQGNRDVIAALCAEEANLLHARRLALQHAWWDPVTSAMQGLRMLYAHTGRRAEWARLVEEIVPHYVDPATDGPRPGREADWGLVTEYRVRLARAARRWAEAERLQRARVGWDQEQAAEVLDAPEEALDDAARHRIRTLAVSLEQLGHILRGQAKPECILPYEEGAELCQRIGDKPEEAIIAFNLGCVYQELPALRDLDEAERWVRRSLELHAAGDRLGRGKCVGQLGGVAYERFKGAREAGAPEETLLAHLNEAAQQYHGALDLLPPDAVNDLAVAHNQLGLIYRDAGDLARSLRHYRESIRYDEQAGNVYGAAQDRYNVALVFMDARRWQDALDYARAALRGFQTFGARAAQGIQDTRRLIAHIEQARQEDAA